MNTFLPYPDYQRSAQVLDYRRLGKQRVEPKQVLAALRQGPKILYSPSSKIFLWKSNPSPDHVDLGLVVVRSTPWYNHPCTRMWAGHERSLCEYALAMIREWKRRGYCDNLEQWFQVERWLWSEQSVVYPWWLGCEDIHSSHRARLLYKDPTWYGQWGWTETPRTDEEGYVWPV